MATLGRSIDEVKSIICDFSNSTGLATVFVDVQGNEISERFNFSGFCEKLRSNDNYYKSCKNCDRLGGLNSLKERNIRCYACHAGLVDFSVPVVKKDNLLGFIQCGQTKIANQSLPNIEKYEQKILSQSSELRILHNKIEPISSGKILSSVNIISRLVNNDISNILKKIDEEELIYSDDICTIKSLNYQTHINEAQDFIKKNLHADVSLERVASHVNLTPQYLCRIFKKNTGVGFSDYVNCQKVAKADRLLSDSELSIKQVAQASGFSSASYFIKQFRKHYNVTPREYRERLEQLQ